MRAVTWHGPRDVRVETVPDPMIEEPTDAIVRITTSGICGSDLHLYEVLGPFMTPGDILGHEPMGIVEEVGSGITGIAPGDRVVMPFQISCGSCFMCNQGLQTQCETTQVTEQGMGAALYGYTKLYGAVPGGQAEYLRVPRADYNPIKVPEGPADDRFVYLSDVLPTAWQAVEYAGIPDGGTVAVMGVGPIGDMACRIAAHRGHRVIAVDLITERLNRVRAFGAETIDLREVDLSDLGAMIRETTDGRGPDAVIDAVGMEAHGSPAASAVQKLTGLLPGKIAERLMDIAGVDRLASLHAAVDVVRRGGTISVIGVYGGAADPMPMLTLFDKQVQLRMGQANVRRWVDDILPLLGDDDPLGVDDFATHRLPLDEAPHGYEIFQKKQDEACKVVLRP
ncbi:zinc-dependent alcohol dehydrogenase [Nocardioides terrisoli]|uniref:zinc-dependent alcohol dehydrogenase n=1 Tax=Nocardioides terrisoli TaxID=3388267 RepID=UPI00287B8B7E|nr:zinc-dependent alcohol dehydrogenase [Nocardioides marmorisolisilvae]